MPKDSYSITNELLRDKHPKLHEAIVGLIAEEPMKYANLKANLSGRYENRKVSYGKLFDVLERNGRKIEINVY